MFIVLLCVIVSLACAQSVKSFVPQNGTEACSLLNTMNTQTRATTTAIVFDLDSMLSSKEDPLNCTFTVSRMETVAFVFRCLNRTSTVYCAPDREGGCFSLVSGVVDVWFDGCRYIGGPVFTAFSCKGCIFTATNVEATALKQGEIDLKDVLSLFRLGSFRSVSVLGSTFYNATQGLNVSDTNNVTVHNVSMRHIFGAGKYASPIDIRNCEVFVGRNISVSTSFNHGNNMFTSGGCMRVSAMRSVLTDSTFDGCDSTSSGGGLSVTALENGSAEVRNVTVRKCSAALPSPGGGIHIESSHNTNILVENVSVLDTTAGQGTLISVAFILNAQLALVTFRNVVGYASTGFSSSCLVADQQSVMSSSPKKFRKRMVVFENTHFQGCGSLRRNFSFANDFLRLDSSPKFKLNESDVKSTWSHTATASKFLTRTLRLIPTDQKVLQKRVQVQISQYTNALLIVAAVVVVPAVVASQYGTIQQLENTVLLSSSPCLLSDHLQNTAEATWITSPLQRVIGMSLLDPIADPVAYNVIVTAMVGIVPFIVVAVMWKAGTSASWGTAMDTSRYPSLPCTIQLMILQGSVFHVIQSLQQNPNGTVVFIALICIVSYPLWHFAYPLVWGYRWRSATTSTNPKFHTFEFLRSYPRWVRYVLPVGSWEPTAHRHYVLYSFQEGRLVEGNVVTVIHAIAIGVLTGVTPSSGAGSTMCIFCMTTVGISFIAVGLYLVIRRPLLSHISNMARAVVHILNGVVTFVLMRSEPFPNSVYDTLYAFILVFNTLDAAMLLQDIVILWCEKKHSQGNGSNEQEQELQKQDGYAGNVQVLSIERMAKDLDIESSRLGDPLLVVGKIEL
eukprot:PhF_6_TR42681/c0_g1_i2/m.64359